MLFALAAMGIGLQVIGLVTAVSGLGQTYHQVTNRRLLLDLVRVRWASQGRRQRRTDRMSTDSVVSISESGEVVLSPTDPGENASADEQVIYLRRYVEILNDRIDALSTETDKKLGRFQHMLDSERSEMAKRLDLAEDEQRILRQLLFGDKGEGLLRTAEGLVITGVGVVFTAAGLPWF